MQDERYNPKLRRPSILERDTIRPGRDSMFYFCYSHYSEHIVGNKRIKTRKICTCEFLHTESIKIVLGVNVRGGVFPSRQYILFYDSSFVSDYILPLFKKEEDRKIIEYTLSNANDSTFKNIIDFEHKVIINENAYYYPINSPKLACVYINKLEWFKSVIPKEKWIYNQNCYNENVPMYLLIPLLEGDTANTTRNSK
jgi:hypothetical protein